MFSASSSPLPHGSRYMKILHFPLWCCFRNNTLFHHQQISLPIVIPYPTSFYPPPLVPQPGPIVRVGDNGIQFQYPLLWVSEVSQREVTHWDVEYQVNWRMYSVASGIIPWVSPLPATPQLCRLASRQKSKVKSLESITSCHSWCSPHTRPQRTPHRTCTASQGWARPDGRASEKSCHNTLKSNWKHTLPSIPSAYHREHILKIIQAHKV